MKLTIISLIAFLLTNFARAQTIQQIDSIAVKMCSSFGELSNVKDEYSVSMVFQRHLTMLYEKLQVQTQQRGDSIKDKVFFRMQLSCGVFREILDKMEENKSDWIKLKEKPKVEISKKQVLLFLKGGHFQYKEYNGDVVSVEISNGFWSETFIDGTVSKLSFHPKNNNEFDLKFIESNNHVRSNLSVKGDVYHYGLYGYSEAEFSLWLQTEKDQTIYAYKMYKL